MKTIVRFAAASAALGLGLVLGPAGARSASADAADGTRLTGYAAQPNGIGAVGIVSGPDGNLWSYLQAPGSAFVDKLSPNGVVLSGYAADGAVADIAAGPDGDVWYAAVAGPFDNLPEVVSVTPDGRQTSFALPAGDGVLTSVTAGPDGRIWFAATGGFIGEISGTGAVTQFPIPDQGDQSIMRLATGSDGALWFTQDLSSSSDDSGWIGVSSVGRITTDGAVTLYPLPSFTGVAGGITLGFDGDVWFTEWSSSLGASKVFSITPSGAMSFFIPVQTGGRAGALTRGPDGNMWIVENFDTAVGAGVHHQIAAVDPGGDQVAVYQEPGQGEVEGLAAGPDGNIWYTDDGSGNAFVQVDLHHGAATTVTLSAVASPSTFRQHALITARVTGSAVGGSPSPALTGWVVFTFDGFPEIAQQLINGETTLDVATSLEAHTVTAQYFGDDTYLGATSLPLTLLVEPPPFAASEQTTAQGSTSVTTPPFNTTGPRLLVALVSADGPKSLLRGS